MCIKLLVEHSTICDSLLFIYRIVSGGFLVTHQNSDSVHIHQTIFHTLFSVLLFNWLWRKAKIVQCTSLLLACPTSLVIFTHPHSIRGDPCQKELSFHTKSTNIPLFSNLGTLLWLSETAVNDQSICSASICFYPANNHSTEISPYPSPQERIIPY